MRSKKITTTLKSTKQGWICLKGSAAAIFIPQELVWPRQISPCRRVILTLTSTFSFIGEKKSVFILPAVTLGQVYRVELVLYHMFLQKKNYHFQTESLHTTSTMTLFWLFKRRVLHLLGWSPCCFLVKLTFWKLSSPLHFNYFEDLGLEALINCSARTFGLAWRGSDRLKMGPGRKPLVLRGPRPAYVSLRGVWIKQQEPKEFSRVSAAEGLKRHWLRIRRKCVCNSHNNHTITPSIISQEDSIVIFFKFLFVLATL